ncbi:glycoside hydrolase family 2 protein [Sodiomyces alkalinus F11]|uniref:Glycoside hydrolase family 2 protein n=1 Tax=Sodiomyces alkalinus (strain CBS 110278 / VKM F-3762 / F11) TaxID=1314773 RepID=A0A3N2PYK1_SODAK|nr:glycoside hydrolase family 2 protein [Sodiomyces alkalinus F11]ROT39613.1 glycoside hydrolase family 2 protein [Sodiomyces alkalinus F11]
MARRLFWLALVADILGRQAATAQRLLVSENGDTTPIPHWDLQSSSETSEDLAFLAQAGADTSSWHHVPVSKCTLMGCLLHIGVYDDDELWFSNNLESFDWRQFTVPWVYRHEFSLAPEAGQHYFLQTHGITSRGDIYLNGELVADREFQSGSYSGHEYDITSLVVEENALLIQVHPTSYYHDLALGFIDWNPSPPDNGTGLWRPVTLKQTGGVSLGPLSALVSVNPGSVTLRATVRNLEDEEVEVSVRAVISEPGGFARHIVDQTVPLGPGESQVVEFNKTFEDPKTWWPKQWGEQPLYSATLSVSVDDILSDTVQQKFGLRTVTSKVDKDDDIVFSINGRPFQVIGGGYSADMFLRFDPERFEAIAKYMLDMGLNTIRLEGNNEQPELYEIADRLGLMVMAGWECCNKWESWEYNRELAIDTPDYWDERDYADANATMYHEAQMLQTHPSMLAFLIGSDFWPDDRATKIYVDALRHSNWQLPIVPAASKRGYPELLGRSGMKMNGPYDWVPPNYWYDTEPSEDRLGAAFGFGSELGAGVGTPEMGSLKKFLTDEDMDDLWLRPNKGLYHMSTNVSQFYNRRIYNEGLFNRYGPPKSLEDYLRKAQIMDYEAIRAEHEAFASRWSTGRIATGMIYWMLVNAWPSLHWNQFDHYLHPAGTYFGSKVGARIEHVSYNYVDRGVWLINRSLDRSGPRTVTVEVVDLHGNEVASETYAAETVPNVASRVADVPGLGNTTDVVFIRLVLRDSESEILSRNVYWIAPSVDQLDWGSSTWYYTPVARFSDYSSLFDMQPASIETAVTVSKEEGDGSWTHTVVLENTSTVPVFFIRLNAIDEDGQDVNPVTWSDNYVTLWPKEKLELRVNDWGGDAAVVHIDAANAPSTSLALR